ncbi:MAG: hypothetical protein WCO56_23350 [Verrucomicrobiota bacterium]
MAGRWLLAVLLLMGAPWLPACSTPVFRYALERWTPSLYEVIVFHRGPLKTNEQTLVHALQDASVEGSGLANYTVTVADLAASPREALTQLWEKQTNAPLPWVVVRYPINSLEIPSAWVGPLTAQNILLLAESPVRRELATRLGKGDALVWLLLESGNRANDDALGKKLGGLLEQTPGRVEFPADPSGDESNTVKMTLSFPVLRVPRESVPESIFSSILQNPDPELSARKEPVILPVFGRGRALAAIPASQISLDVVRSATSYLLGACSCEVKEQNPGFDLLLAVDWEGLLEGKRLSDGPPPGLISLASLMPTNRPTTTIPTTTNLNAAQDAQGAGSLYHSVIYSLLAGLVLVIAASWYFMRK